MTSSSILFYGALCCNLISSDFILKEFMLKHISALMENLVDLLIDGIRRKFQNNFPRSCTDVHLINGRIGAQ